MSRDNPTYPEVMRAITSYGPVSMDREGEIIAQLSIEQSLPAAGTNIGIDDQSPMLRALKKMLTCQENR